MRYLGLLRKRHSVGSSTNQLSKPASSDDWLTAWRELATVTQGIYEHDPRRQRILQLLEQCDEAFLAGNWQDFVRLAQQVKRLSD